MNMTRGILTLCLLGLAGSSAQAQFFPNRGGFFGNNLYGYPNYGFGGIGNGGFTGNYYGGYPGFNGGYSPGFGGGYYPGNSFYYNPQPITTTYFTTPATTVPGVSSMNPYAPPPRSRSSLAPAIPYRPAPGADLHPQAHLDLNVPAEDAQVTINGVAMTQTGLSRNFVTPPLTLGTRYGYEVQVRWNDRGESRTRTKTVDVRAGEHYALDFTKDL